MQQSKRLKQGNGMAAISKRGGEREKDSERVSERDSERESKSDIESCCFYDKNERSKR